MTAGKQGDRALVSDAFTQNYRATYVYVVAFARRRLWDVELARDITAETYRVAWTKALSGQVQALPQLYAICRNLIGDQIRSSRREIAASSLTLPLERPDSKGTGAFEQAFELLSEIDQEALKLKYWELLSAAEIAVVIECSEQAAWARLSRARKNLKESLEKAGITYVSK